MYLVEGRKIDLGGKELEVIEIPGHTPGSVAFLDKADKKQYTLSEAVPDVIRIRDYFGYNRAYLVKGSRKTVLVDTTMGEGDLPAVVEKHAGGLPVVLLLTHGHIDHSFSANQFETVYLNRKEFDKLPKHIDPSSFRDIRPEDIYDLGNMTLQAYALPGHTSGSMVFICPEKRLLFSGDAVGTQSTQGGLWLQLPGCLYVDEYHDVLKNFIEKTRGRYDLILTGQNAEPVGAGYLDYMLRAARKVIDQGEAVLVPSVRPEGIKMVVYGDDDDPLAASINLDPGHLLSGDRK